MSYLTPRTFDDAFAGLASGAQIIAGGTDWFPARGDRIGDVSLLDITGLPGMGAIERTDAGWRIGAGVTWSQVIAADLPPCFDALKAAAREVGSVQIQNVGTIAGNLCNASPAADGVPPLLVLDAQIEVVSTSGTRLVPLDDFITGPRSKDLAAGEMVSAIVIPDQPPEAVSHFAKSGARAYLVISVAMVAVQACLKDDGSLHDLRIAVGSCGPKACRLRGLEARLEGSAPPPDIALVDLSELSPIDDMRGTADYRFDLVTQMITRGLRGLA